MPDQPFTTRSTEAARPAQFYTREREGDPLFGPLDYNSMDASAREASKENDSGIIYCVVLLGSRTGDSFRNPLMEIVKWVYFRGRRLGGSKIGLGRIRPYVQTFHLIAEDGAFLLTEDDDLLNT